MRKAERARETSRRLRLRYPQPKAALDWSTPWELLVATVLSAQCTDVQVNKTTPALFAAFPTIDDMAKADTADIEAIIRGLGLFRNKAKHLKAAAEIILRDFHGHTPDTMEGLISLPGVARKTANIVLSNAFGKNDGIAVDTHVKRLAKRMGLTGSDNVAVIEKDLMKLFPQEEWGDINHFLVFFGREVCPARKPHCPICELADICPKKGVPKEQRQSGAAA